MIASIRGIILSVKDYLIIETSGLGYKVFVPTSLRDHVKVGEDIQLFTHQHIREDAVELHGFQQLAELELFEKLISVSGVGPKAGLALLSQFSADDLQSSIVRGDTSLLTKVSGIGKKTAERLILELRGALAEHPIDHITLENTGSVVVDALEQLGYSAHEVLQALKYVDTNTSEEEQIKTALSHLSGSR